MFYANANNLNDDHTPGANGEWSPLKQTEGMTKAYEAGMDYNYGSIDRTRYYGSFHKWYKVLYLLFKPEFYYLKYNISNIASLTSPTYP